jgi:hypothetical protein
MKKIMIFAISILAVAPWIFPQQAAVPNHGNTALMFSIAGLGDFGIGGVPLGIAVPTARVASIPLSGLGLKFYLSDKVAVRGLLMAGYVGTNENKDTTLTVGIAPALEYHFVRTPKVGVYIGGALAMGYYQHKIPSSNDYGDNYPEQKTTGTVFGLAFLLGAEFFPLENFSLGLEYQIGVSVTGGKYQAGSVSTDFPKSIAFGIGTAAVTAAIYW